MIRIITFNITICLKNVLRLKSGKGAFVNADD
jgi:hypothetical protein